MPPTLAVGTAGNKRRKRAILALFFAFFLLLAPPADAEKKARNPLSLPDKDWQIVLSLLKSDDATLAQKLLTWIYATESDTPIHAPDLIAFADANPGWPRLHVIREKIEKNISGAEMPARNLIDWFERYPPTTYNGMKTCMKALLAEKKNDEAARRLSAFWRKARLDKNETAGIVSAYGRLLTAKDHAARLDHLLWEDRYTEAGYMLAFVGKNAALVGKARIALGRRSAGVSRLLHDIPPALQDDEGLLFDRLRWRRKKNLDDEAMEIVSHMPDAPARADLWWGELNILARRAIEKKDYARAYDIAAHNRSQDPVDFSAAEWLLGWLALQQGLPQQAYAHFDTMYRSVSSAVSKSRGAYWAATAAEKIPDPALAQNWHRVSAQYPSTFYGQLSYVRLNGAPAASSFRDPVVANETWHSFNRQETARAARLLAKAGLPQLADSFLAKLVAEGRDMQDYYMTARLARETERFSYAVQANKEAQQKAGAFLFGEGYPVLPALPLQAPEKSLVHAIIHRESMFDAQARSTAGALGLMQLMPSTAKAVSKRAGQSYNAARLTREPRYNVLVGSTYLKQLLDKYGHSYPLAIAAYNAGPSNVDDWIEEFGDPRDKGVDVLDWVEHIPIYETRNYVQRVLESYYIYRLRFSEPPLTIREVVRS